MSAGHRSPYARVLLQAGAALAWLVFAGLALSLLIQCHELVRLLGPRLIPANFEQEVASRWRPVLLANTVLISGAIGWVAGVIIMLGRFQRQASGTGLLHLSARTLGPSGLGVLALLWLERILQARI